jgi:hypothetical protein
LAVASLVLGILGIVLCWFPASAIGVPLAIVGLILGIVARKNATAQSMPTGLPTAGLVLSVIGMILSIASLVACAACMTAMNQQIANDPKLREQLQRQNQGFDEAAKKLQEPHPPGVPAGNDNPAPAGTTAAGKAPAGTIPAGAAPPGTAAAGKSAPPATPTPPAAAPSTTPPAAPKPR